VLLDFPEPLALRKGRYYSRDNKYAAGHTPLVSAVSDQVLVDVNHLQIHDLAGQICARLISVTVEGQLGELETF
jgi:hypothetical protein